MKFGNNHVVLELFGIGVRQGTLQEANSLYRCAGHGTEPQPLVIRELHPQAQWTTGQLLQEALSMHWDTASRFSGSREATYRKPGWETMGEVKGVYIHKIGSCVRTGKNPVPDLWSALLDCSPLVLEHYRGPLGSRGYLARHLLCFKEKEVSYFLAESPSSKNKTKPR